MKRLLLLPALLLLTACPNVANTARDTAAALGGALVEAQSQNLTLCANNPAQPVCQIIKRGIEAQNALITATETYCGWSANAVPPVGQACAPVSSAQAALTAAINNANLEITEIKGVIQ